MKQTLNLYSDFKYPDQVAVDYFMTYEKNDYLICGQFVKAFLGVDKEPPFIKLTYTTKNPKEKGFKKITISKIVDYKSNVYISGKFWSRTDFFPNALSYFPQSFDTFNVWIKIEILNP